MTIINYYINKYDRFNNKKKRYILKLLNADDYNSDYRLKNKLPYYLKHALIGVLLSDGGLERSSETSNPRLSIIMSINSYPNIFHLFNLFEPYINSPLQVVDINNKSKIGLNKKYTTIIFKTISMPLL